MKVTSLDLLYAIGETDERYIVSAKTPPRRMHASAKIAIAACLLIIVVPMILLLRIAMTPSSAPAPDSSVDNAITVYYVDKDRIAQSPIHKPETTEALFDAWLDANNIDSVTLTGIRIVKTESGNALALVVSGVIEGPTDRELLMESLRLTMSGYYGSIYTDYTIITETDNQGD